MFPYSSIANHQSRNHEMPTPPTFQELVLKLQTFWAQRGCVLQQPYDVEVGAGTMAPAASPETDLSKSRRFMGVLQRFLRKWLEWDSQGLCQSLTGS